MDICVPRPDDHGILGYGMVFAQNCFPIVFFINISKSLLLGVRIRGLLPDSRASPPVRVSYFHATVVCYHYVMLNVPWKVKFQGTHSGLISQVVDI